MKIHNLIFTSLFLTMLSHHVLAADTCSVLGVHEPNTNIYDGPTWCESVHLKDITVRGPLSAKRVTVSGNVDVSGPIQSGDSSFQNIVIHSSLSHAKVILSQHTTVSGDLVFKGVKGKVFIDKTSKVVGRIINADVKQVQ